MIADAVHQTFVLFSEWQGRIQELIRVLLEKYYCVLHSRDELKLPPRLRSEDARIRVQLEPCDDATSVVSSMEAL